MEGRKSVNKKNSDKIITTFNRVIYPITIIAMLISTATTAWAGNAYNRMRQAIEKNRSTYEELISVEEEVIRTEERASEIYDEMIKVTEENSEIYKELIQLLKYPEKD